MSQEMLRLILKILEEKLTAKHSLLLELSKKISNSRKKIIPILKSDLGVSTCKFRYEKLIIQFYN